MVQVDDTLLVAALLAAPVGYAWEFAFWPWMTRRREAVENCQHDLYREGGPYCRTEKCRKCRHQRPITMTRCPKCREWSDAE